MPVKHMPDILYLFLPIGGAFMLLCLVCFCGRKVKEVFHFPKQVIDLPINDPSLMRRRRRKSDSDDEYGPIYTVSVRKKEPTSWKSRIFKSVRRRPEVEYTDGENIDVEMEPMFIEQRMIIDPLDLQQSLAAVPSCSGCQSKSKSAKRNFNSTSGGAKSYVLCDEMVNKMMTEKLERSMSLPDIHST